MKSLLSLLIPFCCVFTTTHANEQVSTINYSITLECPTSPEYDALERTIPSPDYQSPNREEWARTTIDELEHIIALIQSGNFEKAQVNFGSSNHTEKDLSNLWSADLSLHLLCYDCSELEALKSNRRNETKNNQSYSDWSAQAMKSLHDVQMLILKGKTAIVKSQKIEGELNDPQDAEILTEIKCSLSIKGPPSDEFQSLLDAIPNENTLFKSHNEWKLATIHAIHKLEMLILSGKIKLGGVEIQ